MQGIISASKARADFSRFIDSVVHEKPHGIQRHRDVMFNFSLEHLLSLIDDKVVTVDYHKDNDGTIYGSVKELDITGYGDTVDDFIDDIAIQMKEYAEDYYNNFTRYFHSTNRKSHFPYIMNILIQDDVEAVKVNVIKRG
ncbi:hypothetical protein [Salipaludibacillus neizhouensis]|nr:hypothetical protein [Salipaludibacillus neizhouensis]